MRPLGPYFSPGCVETAVPSHYSVSLENQALRASVDPRRERPHVGLGSGLAVAIAAR
jgi:hypothetical protein